MDAFGQKNVQLRLPKRLRMQRWTVWAAIPSSSVSLGSRGCNAGRFEGIFRPAASPSPIAARPSPSPIAARPSPPAKRVLAIDRDGRAMAPCGACREFMEQFMPNGYRNVEIMLDYETRRIVTLGELTPEWWI